MKSLVATGLICLFFISAFVFQIPVATACDACGSNMGSFYPGFADIGNSFLSFSTTVRTSGVYIPAGYRWMTSFNGKPGHLHPNFEKSAYYDQTHIFNELRFSYSLGKMSFGVVAPLVQKKLFRSGELIENNIGMGDVRVTLLYRALNQQGPRRSVTNRIFVGGGFSLPTGESGEPGYDGMIEPSRQTGTGTFGFLLNAAYQLNVKKFGISLQSVFQTFDTDSRGYRFGNLYNFSGRAYYEVKAGRLILTPSVGINLEMAGKDKLNKKEYFLDTGGKSIWSPVGIDIFYKSFGASFTWYVPVSEELNGLQFESKHYFSAGIRYVFKKT